MSMKTTFMNGVVEQPQGFETHGRQTDVCILKKASYGLKQAPKAWYGRIGGYLMVLGFTKSKEDHNLYFNVVYGGPIILLLYVDDLFLTSVENLIDECKKTLASEFEMKDLGIMHHFLGLELWQRPDKIFLNQAKYAVEILNIFGMMDCKAMPTMMAMNLNLFYDTSSETVDTTMYRHLVGSLMYLTNMRPDMCFVMNKLSQYMVEPRCVHLVAEKHALRYLKGIVDYGLMYDVNCEIRLHGYADSNWAGSVADRKSASGCCFNLGSSMISRFNKK
jgi:hypothetical protein